MAGGVESGDAEARFEQAGDERRQASGMRSPAVSEEHTGPAAPLPDRELPERPSDEGTGAPGEELRFAVCRSKSRRTPKGELRAHSARASRKGRYGSEEGPREPDRSRAPQPRPRDVARRTRRHMHRLCEFRASSGTRIAFCLRPGDAKRVAASPVGASRRARNFQSVISIPVEEGNVRLLRGREGAGAPEKVGPMTRRELWRSRLAFLALVT